MSDKGDKIVLLTLDVQRELHSLGYSPAVFLDLIEESLIKISNQIDEDEEFDNRIMFNFTADRISYYSAIYSRTFERTTKTYSGEIIVQREIDFSSLHNKPLILYKDEQIDIQESIREGNTYH